MKVLMRVEEAEGEGVMSLSGECGCVFLVYFTILFKFI